MTSIEQNPAIEPLPRHPRRIERLYSLAELLDTRFRLPLIGYRVGLDGLIGLIPGVGDAATGAVGLYIINEALGLGVRKRICAKMLLNLGFDFLLGLVPLLGDVLDFVNKANAKNVQLILREYEAGRLRI